MSKSVAIIQSNYIPWKGYFDIIGSVDEFIIYDEVQYTKNDWRNRNKIKTPNGVAWITIPVFQRSLSQKISETQVSDTRWASKHWNMLKTNYGKAAYFRTMSERLVGFYSQKQSPLLSEINLALIRIVCDILCISTKITSSAEYKLEGNPTERLVSLCKQSGAGVYLSGPAAKNYLDLSLFEQENISVEWMEYSNYPEYQQLYPPFEHGVSIVDLIFNTGERSTEFMKFTSRNRSDSPTSAL